MKEGAIETNTNYDDAYTDKKDGMWLGASLAVQPGENETIVTCGPLWKNQYHDKLQLVNGVCYSINGDLEGNSVKKLLPLTKRDNQYGKYMGRTSEYDHAHGQVGISAAFSEDGSNLLLGAPGVWSWKGSVVHYPGYSGDGNDFYSNPDINKPTPEISFNAYFGYSVATGKFFDSIDADTETQFYAVGAPRDGMHHGRVYIISFKDGRQRIRLRKEGVQLGEYFGSSLLGMNLNSDNYTDLLVGAPLNSLESDGDEGKVYVYISNGNDLVKDIELTGDSQPGARFGTALANIGDLNQDGFTDFAVGAPYEDGTGAVYIYHCSSTGVNPEYVQKVKASVIQSTLSGFGIHISRGLDIDGNGYPDILVGSYISANAVLLRSRPFIHVKSEVSFTPKQINVNHTCEVNGQNLPCFRMEACVSYTGKFYLNTVMGFALGFGVDGGRAMFFKPNTTEPSPDRKGKTCASKWIHLQPNMKDHLTPLAVFFYHRMVSPDDNSKEFSRTLPMYHPSSPTKKNTHITFHTGCSEENDCYSDLSVSVTRIEPTKSRVLTLGKIRRISVAITVTNNGEPAYLSELLIYLPREMPVISQDICEEGYTKPNSRASLVCNLGNPLKDSRKVNINIKLDATKIPPYTKYLQIVCEAITLSNDTNPDDNSETLPLHLETISDVGLTGISLQDQVLYEETQKSMPIITHTYVVRNHGPSPVEKINIFLRVPRVILTSEGRKPFVYLTVEVMSELRRSIPAVCEDTSLYSRNVQSSIIGDDNILFAGEEGNTSIPLAPKNSAGPSSGRTKRSDVDPEMEEKNETVTDSSNMHKRTVISCSSKDVGCITLRCTASPFTDIRKFSQLSISLQVDFSILNDKLGQWYEMEFVTSGSISVSEKAVFQLNKHPKSAQVKTIILQEGAPPSGTISPSIIFLSVGVGVVLLLIILIILIKIGFFKRKEKDRMKEMLYDDQMSTEQETNETNYTVTMEE